MSGKKVPLWDEKSRAVYKRLLGYSARYWPVAIIAIIGMAIDSGCLALFTNKLRPIMDDLTISAPAATPRTRRASVAAAGGKAPV